MIDTIIDLYHREAADLRQAAAGGMIALIHKATQGTTFCDSRYAGRREEARRENMKFGSYHFGNGESVRAQAANYLAHATPAADEVICLDWEPNQASTMTRAQAREFVTRIHDQTGRWPMLYGGSLIREAIGDDHDEILANCPLWYARYGPQPLGVPPNTWRTWTLWQYTDGSVGPQPHTVPGIGPCDRSRFAGTAAQLQAAWPFSAPSPAPGQRPKARRSRAPASRNLRVAKT